MIELRWVERGTQIDQYTNGFVRVLQYREWSPGTIPGIEPNWIDVPVVQEPAGSGPGTEEK